MFRYNGRENTKTTYVNLVLSSFNLIKSPKPLETWFVMNVSFNHQIMSSYADFG